MVAKKGNILDRYQRTRDGRVVIEVATAKVEDLYNDFDKSAPHYKKDLEEDLVDYLIDCVRDIGSEHFVLRFRFPGDNEEPLRQRVRASLANYFDYLREIEARSLAQMVRSSVIFLIIGLIVLSLSIWVNRIPGITDTVSGAVFAEGLTIAAWISLWESLATFAINWPPRKRQIKRCERLASALVFFGDDEK
ncbi:MAG: hypothetical protein OEV59_07455 [Deltaproteobacteria bacterium]|nr:hypothetical protein [Deltaproteobacteria bacterium]